MRIKSFLFSILFVGAVPLPGVAGEPTDGSNNLSNLPSLSGVYYGIRHGESVPSSQKRVCSSMEAGVDPANGLTEKGREEVVKNTTAWIEANQELIAKYLQKDKLVIVSSPFSRTKESAEIVADTIQVKFKKKLPKALRGNGALKQRIVIEEDLRERYFGKFEGQGNSDEVYKKVWVEDTKNPGHGKWKVESANAVQARATQVISKLEEDSKANGGKLFLLVAHGDTLKITQTGFQKQSASAHCDPKQVPKFQTAEIRELVLAGQ